MLLTCRLLHSWQASRDLLLQLLLYTYVMCAWCNICITVVSAESQAADAKRILDRERDALKRAQQEQKTGTISGCTADHDVKQVRTYRLFKHIATMCAQHFFTSMQ